MKFNMIMFVMLAIAGCVVVAGQGIVQDRREILFQSLTVPACIDSTTQCSGHGVCLSMSTTPTVNGRCSCNSGYITPTNALNDTYCGYEAKGWKAAITLAAIPVTGIMFGGGYWHLEQWKWMAISTGVFWGGLLLKCCVLCGCLAAVGNSDGGKVLAQAGMACYSLLWVITFIVLWGFQLYWINNYKITDGNGQVMVDTW